MTSDKLPVASAVVSPTDGCVVTCFINPYADVVHAHRGTRLRLVKRFRSLLKCQWSQKASQAVELHLEMDSDKTLLEMVMQQDDNGPSLSQTLRDQLLQMLKKHWKPFAEGAHDHGQSNQAQLSVHTGDSQPTHQMPHRVPVEQREEAHKAVQDMLERDVIHHPVSLGSFVHCPFPQDGWYGTVLCRLPEAECSHKKGCLPPSQS